MGLQQKIEDKLLQNYRQLFTLIAIVLILGLMSYLYFSLLPRLTGEAMQIEHRRLQYVLASIRSQWQQDGMPSELELHWMDTEVAQDSVINMSNGGWPLPAELSDIGCKDFWYQLLGVRLDSWQITGKYLVAQHTCEFIAANLTKITFNLKTGEVNFSGD